MRKFTIKTYTLTTKGLSKPTPNWISTNSRTLLRNTNMCAKLVWTGENKHVHITQEWYMGRCESKNIHQKRHMFKSDWNTYSKYANHSRLNSHHKWGMGTCITIQWVWKTSHWRKKGILLNSKNYEANGIKIIWICLPSCTRVEASYNWSLRRFCAKSREV